MTAPQKAVEVPHCETSGLRIGSLCSGAGGLDLAVEQVFNAETAWHGEYDPAASKVLAHRWPGVPNLGDITKIDWTLVEWVEIIVAGFPCQDVSAAGRRAGLKNGTRTGIFANVMQAIETIRPRLVILENVLGLLSADGDEWPDSVHALNNEAARWARIVGLIGAKKAKAQRKGHRDREWWHRKEAEGIRASRRLKRTMAEFRRERLRLVPRAIATVLGSLAQAGYDAQWTCLRASEVGAPHQRERIFIVASPAAASHNGREGRTELNAIGLRTELGHDADRRDAGTGRGDDSDGVDAPLLPTPKTAQRASRKALTQQHWSAPGLEQALELARGELPREYQSWDEVQGSSGLLPTPCAQQSGNTPENHLAKKPGRQQVTDLAILVENDLLATGGLLPTPTSRDHKGAAHTGRDRPECDDALPDAVLRQVREQPLLPTPSAADGAGGMTSRSGDRKGELLLGGIVRTLLPTPAAADGQRGQDYARAGRDGSGGDDLITAMIKAHNDSQWGKYADAVQRWEQVTHPAPSPTELNRNDKPRLNPRFSEWMMGWPPGWVTDLVPSPSLRVEPDIAITRNDALRIIGNGVVTLQAIAALNELLQIAEEAA